MAKKVKVTHKGKDSTLVQKFISRMKGEVYVANPATRAKNKIEYLTKQNDSLKRANDSLTIIINERKK